MKLDFKKLQEIGAFVGAPVEKTINWTQTTDDGEKVENTGTVHIRRNSCATFDREIRSHIAGDQPTPAKIAANVCDEKGKPILTAEQAADLDENLTAALLTAIVEVNSPKNSNPPTNSGTSLSSQASAGKQSRKRSEA